MSNFVFEKVELVEKKDNKSQYLLSFDVDGVKKEVGLEIIDSPIPVLHRASLEIEFGSKRAALIGRLVHDFHQGGVLSLPMMIK
jgi:hypothetical protein